MNTLTVVLFGAGAILLYAGIKDVNPKDVVTLSLSGQSPSSAAGGGGTTTIAPAPSVYTHPAKPNNNGSTANV